MILRRLGGILAILGLLIVGCAAPQPETILDQGARFPTDEGVVTEGDYRRIQLDSARRYPVSEDVESFKTRSHEVIPPGHWKGTYAHVGVRNKQVIWVAVIGVVPDGDAPTVVYSGVFDRMEKGRAVFRDGTALKLGPGIKAPPKDKESVAVIDPAKKIVTSLQSS